MTVSQYFQRCSKLPGSIKSHNSNENFLREFKQLFGSQEAKNTGSVLYAFFCEKKIPRVKGDSNVIYIGKTKQLLEGRYWCSWTEGRWSDAAREFFNYVIKHYGPVRLAYLVINEAQSLKEAESDLLKNYYELHMELPPKNAQGYGAWGG